MKKIVLSVGIVASLGFANAAHAGYYETFNNFGGDFVINGFQDGNDKFNISLTKLDGTLSLEIPAAGTYGAWFTAGTSLSIAYKGDGTSLGFSPLPAALSIGSGTVSSVAFAIPGVSSLDFNFNGVGTSSFLLNGVLPVAVGKSTHVDVSGSGATSLFAALLGIPGFLTGSVSGTLGVDITYINDALNFAIDASKTVGSDLEAVLAGLDALGNRDGKIDGTFAANGSVHIPEPGSLALLGLGLVGLAVRRRKSVNAV